MTDDATPQSESRPNDPSPAAFDELNTAGTANGGHGASLDVLSDLSLPLSIEFGRTHMTVQDILQLGRGSVIQLDRLAGEPVDVFVSDRKLAEGEVVVIGEQFGVRITRIISPGNMSSGQS